MESPDLRSRFGELERVFRPSPGQTLAGTFVTGGFAVVCFIIAAPDPLERFGAIPLGLLALGIAYWFYLQGRWRLMIFSRGLVQARSGGVEELLWAETREVIRTRLKTRGEPTIGLTFVGPTSSIVVSPVNYRSRERMFELLLATAERLGIPVRIEWKELD